MSLEDWLEKESRMHRFAIHLRNVRRVDSLERSDDNSVNAKTRVTAKGEFKREMIEDSVVVESVGKELASLPLSVDFRFLTPESMAKNEAYGFLQFWEAVDSSDGIVNSPDSLTLTILLPENLLARFAGPGRAPYLSVRLGDFDEVETGAMPGLSKLVWKDSVKTHLLVKECVLVDDIGDEAEEQGEDPAEGTRASTEEVRPTVVSLHPELLKMMVMGFAIIAILLFGVLLKADF